MKKQNHSQRNLTNELENQREDIRRHNVISNTEVFSSSASGSPSGEKPLSERIVKTYENEEGLLEVPYVKQAVKRLKEVGNCGKSNTIFILTKEEIDKIFGFQEEK